MIEELHVAYCARADGLASGAVDELFTDDGELVLGSLRLDGAAAIRDFFAARPPERRTRHVASNLRLADAGGGVVRAASLITIFAGTGALPLRTTVPAAVVDLADVCVLSDEGWRFRSRRASAAAVGPGAAPFFLPSTE